MNGRTKLNNLFNFDRENAGMSTIITKNAYYGFLILNNPKIIEENNKDLHEASSKSR